MFEDFLKGIEVAWDEFIKEERISSIVSRVVEDSWKRCKRNGVDPYGGKGSKVSDEVFFETLRINDDLITTAIPIMENLNSIVLGTGFVLVLTDKNGVILHVVGEKGVKEDASRLNFVPGSLWSEELVGTNAIGTCIKELTPIQTIGAEHYCKEHHPWTCSAAPIKNQNGELIGILDMSGYCLAAHKHTLGIVVAAAFSIENQLSLKQSYELLDTTVESILDGMMILDNDFKIFRVNKVGNRILGIKQGQLDGVDARHILGDKIFRDKNSFQGRVDWDFSIGNNRIPCNIRITSIDIDKSMKGMAIIFREMKEVHNTVNVVSGNKAIFTFENILTENERMEKAIRDAQKFSRTRGCVLLEGESVTGKELFAHAIHNFSSRSNGPFVAINCASLPKDLVESELFGYEKGAFTGALKEGKVGKFELANGGTLFLDEIGELPLDLQAKLLRVLDDYVITRVGGKISKKLDVRVIVATNRDLLEEVRRKSFREDLYYRLNVFNVKIPPLRDRKEDVRILTEHFLKRLNFLYSTEKRVYAEFFGDVKNCQWKGNVRELENMVQRAFHLCEDNVITKELLPCDLVEHWKESMDINMDTIKDSEKEVIIKALIKNKGDVIEAGNMIGVSKSSIYRKLKEHDINPKSYKQNSHN